MKPKIDLNKFVCSLVKRYYEKIRIDPTTTKCWLDSVLEDQGLEYKDGEIVEIEQESEDERVRKALINLIKSKEEDGYMVINNFSTGSILAWLENQASKPKWTEEDECYMSECISAITTKDSWSFEEKRKTKHWLKSLKERMI